MVQGVYEFSVKWDGVNWVSEPLKSGRIVRGRDDEFVSVNAGTCNVWLRDLTARYNPANTSSPIYPYVAQPLKEARLRVTLDAVTYDLFTGYTRRVESDPSRTGREGRVQCVDFFVQLGRVKPTIGSTVTTTGGAIGLVLDAVGFPGGASRDLDTGDTITFSADGSTSGLQCIAKLLETERGFFFIGAGGVATYRDRYASNRSPFTSSQSTIADTMQYLAPSSDLDLIRNRATVTRTGGTPQTATDAASVALYNYADFDPIASDYLASDAAAAALARYLVLKRKDAIPPIRQLDLNNGQVVPFTALLARDLGDRITVSDTIGGTSGDYHIQSIAHEFNASQQIHRSVWGLLRRDTATQPFIVGSSLVGGPDLISY